MLTTWGDFKIIFSEIFLGSNFPPSNSNLPAMKKKKRNVSLTLTRRRSALLDCWEAAFVELMVLLVLVLLMLVLIILAVVCRRLLNVKVVIIIITIIVVGCFK